MQQKQQSKHFKIMFLIILPITSFKYVSNECFTNCQDGRAVQGAAFRSQSSSLGVGSNPTSDKHVFFLENFYIAPAVCYC